MEDAGLGNANKLEPTMQGREGCRRRASFRRVKARPKKVSRRILISKVLIGKTRTFIFSKMVKEIPRIDKFSILLK